MNLVATGAGVLFVVLMGLVMVHRKMMNMDPFFWRSAEKEHARKSQQLMLHITKMVSEVGEHTGGPLQGQVPLWLVPLNHVYGGGNGTVKVLVSSQQEYYILHFDVKNWQATYGEIQPYPEETAQKLMKLHLQALGLWHPLQTVH